MVAQMAEQQVEALRVGSSKLPRGTICPSGGTGRRTRPKTGTFFGIVGSIPTSDTTERSPAPYPKSGEALISGKGVGWDKRSDLIILLSHGAVRQWDPQYASIAQLAERSIDNREVAGSNPARSTTGDYPSFHL